MIYRLAIGRLFVWLLQINGLLEPIWGYHKKLTELKECDLCLGFWVYLVIYLLPRDDRFIPEWPKLAEDIVLAGCSAMMAHLVRTGWNAKFDVDYLT
jgi:hypothetical protein